jgi:GT2 family glycosyltransferase
MLNRALGSIASQTYQDYELVIINDGGVLEEVNSLVDGRSDSLSSIKVIHNDNSLGRAHAANQGCREATGEYIVFLDDDDTWQPDFLEKTHAFLQSNNDFHAVSVHATCIEEKIIGTNISELKRYPAEFNSESITIMQMAQFNRLTTNGTVFERVLFDELGGFDEKLMFIVDYDFFLRMLLITDIAVIPECLANFHIRKDAQEDESLNNTVTASNYWHVQNTARYRNYHLRKDLEQGKFGLGAILAQAEEANQLKDFRNEWHGAINTLSKLPGVELVKNIKKRLSND